MNKTVVLVVVIAFAMMLVAIVSFAVGTRTATATATQALVASTSPAVPKAPEEKPAEPMVSTPDEGQLEEEEEEIYENDGPGEDPIPEFEPIAPSPGVAFSGVYRVNFQAESSFCFQGDMDLELDIAPYFEPKSAVLRRNKAASHGLCPWVNA